MRLLLFRRIDPELSFEAPDRLNEYLAFFLTYKLQNDKLLLLRSALVC